MYTTSNRIKYNKTKGFPFTESLLFLVKITCISDVMNWFKVFQQFLSGN